MAKTVTIKKSAAIKLLTELGEKKAKGWSPKKLTEKIAGLEIESLDEDLVESISKPSTKVLQKVAEGISKSAKFSIEDEDVAEEPKAGKPAKAAKAGKAEKEPKEKGEPSNRRAQGHAIDEAVLKAKGPFTADDIFAKASKVITMSEARVNNHLSYLEQRGKLIKGKGGKYSLT